MSIAFWILWIFLLVWILVDVIRTGTKSVELWLITALLFVLGAAAFGWPG
jgi:hypothetical protein